MEAVRQSTVSAQIAGRMVDLRFDVGDYVKKGDVIVRIDERSAARALEASEAQVLEAAGRARQRARAVRALASSCSRRNSSARRRSTRRRPPTRRRRRASARSSPARAQAATERSFATVVAPYSGVVSARHIELGEMATPGRPLMTGFDPSTLRVVATVPQAQVAAIQAGGKARIEVPSLGRWVDVKAMTIVPAADPRTHTTRIRLELPADVRGVYPGVYARAHFVVGKAPRLLVPRAAVVRRSEVTAVYVVDEQGRAQLRQIRLGTAGDENVGRGARRPEAGRARRARAHQGGNGLAAGPEHGRLRPHRALLPGLAAHAAAGAGRVPARRSSPWR